MIGFDSHSDPVGANTIILICQMRALKSREVKAFVLGPKVGQRQSQNLNSVLLDSTRACTITHCDLPSFPPSLHPLLPLFVLGVRFRKDQTALLFLGVLTVMHRPRTTAVGDGGRDDGKHGKGGSLAPSTVLGQT